MTHRLKSYPIKLWSFSIEYSNKVFDMISFHKGELVWNMKIPILD